MIFLLHQTSPHFSLSRFSCSLSFAPSLYLISHPVRYTFFHPFTLLSPFSFSPSFLPPSLIFQAYTLLPLFPFSPFLISHPHTPLFLKPFSSFSKPRLYHPSLLLIPIFTSFLISHPRCFHSFFVLSQPRLYHPSLLPIPLFTLLSSFLIFAPRCFHSLFVPLQTRLYHRSLLPFPFSLSFPHFSSSLFPIPFRTSPTRLYHPSCTPHFPFHLPFLISLPRTSLFPIPFSSLSQTPPLPPLSTPHFPFHPPFLISHPRTSLFPNPFSSLSQPALYRRSLLPIPLFTLLSSFSHPHTRCFPIPFVLLPTPSLHPSLLLIPLFTLLSSFLILIPRCFPSLFVLLPTPSLPSLSTPHSPFHPPFLISHPHTSLFPNPFSSFSNPVLYHPSYSSFPFHHPRCFPIPFRPLPTPSLHPSLLLIPFSPPFLISHPHTSLFPIPFSQHSAERHSRDIREGQFSASSPREIAGRGEELMARGREFRYVAAPEGVSDEASCQVVG
ncbi:hypothetical protein C7M84_022103 [Penaeus vannamei]|uniref:Uncharacterized protein n=1 Tax=Penaeus vannamei TaxID=6689 RepID=A0A423U7J9_PENVA|nr:hypothetical protein C7M84_022103 [Penaeus vannamei]